MVNAVSIVSVAVAETTAGGLVEALDVAVVPGRPEGRAAEQQPAGREQEVGLGDERLDVGFRSEDAVPGRVEWAAGRKQDEAEEPEPVAGWCRRPEPVPAPVLAERDQPDDGEQPEEPAVEHRVLRREEPLLGEVQPADVRVEVQHHPEDDPPDDPDHDRVERDPGQRRDGFDRSREPAAVLVSHTGDERRPTPERSSADPLRISLIRPGAGVRTG
jgi:hypothetical protein